MKGRETRSLRHCETCGYCIEAGVACEKQPFDCPVRIQFEWEITETQKGFYAKSPYDRLTFHTTCD